jgi:PAS domain-containing protein
VRFAGHVALHPEGHLHEMTVQRQRFIEFLQRRRHVPSLEHAEEGRMATRRADDQVRAMLAAIRKPHSDGPIVFDDDLRCLRAVVNRANQIAVALLDGHGERKRASLRPSRFLCVKRLEQAQHVQNGKVIERDDEGKHLAKSGAIESRSQVLHGHSRVSPEHRNGGPILEKKPYFLEDADLPRSA